MCERRYWRLISTNSKAAKRVILSSRPPLTLQYQEEMSDEMLYYMLEEMGTVSAVYYRKADEFITPRRGPSPVSTNSPIPEDEADVALSESEASSDSDSLDIFSDESDGKEDPVEKVATRKSSVEVATRKGSVEKAATRKDSFDDIFS